MSHLEKSEENTVIGAPARNSCLKDSREEEAISRDANTAEIVVFSETDPEDPKNWSATKKNCIICILCMLSFTSVFGSSSYAPGETQIQKTFGVNAEVASTGLTVYVLGFAFGPLLWAVIIPSAFVDNLAVILVFRFFAGCCAACALNKFLDSGSGTIADMYASTPRKLQQAIGYYAFCPLSGPIFGSIVGFFVAAHLTHGLWVVRVHWFMVIAIWPLVFVLPETHGPTILARRAKRIRKEGHANAFAAHELHAMTRKELVWSHIGRPISEKAQEAQQHESSIIAMLFTEPIIIGAAIWVSLAYSIIYFFFEAFPVVFIEQNNIPFQLGGLPFLGITLGMLVCVLTMDTATQHSRRITIPFVDPPGSGTPVDAPEAGLKVVLISCAFLPISMFWFAWTSRGDVHWISPVLAGIFFGYSMLSIFYSFSGYSAQTYKVYASSAQASNTLARSIVASVFPVIAHPILKNLGTAWGISLFGFLSLGLIPIPVIFLRYGPVLREKSHFASEANRILAGMRKRRDEEVIIEPAGDREGKRGAIEMDEPVGVPAEA
ncbi:MFS general substrate transporter [Phellopilus nigrolimitatus]|nr:MFS general substrate transporter [Phellopilus nigrolimitatus]